MVLGAALLISACATTIPQSDPTPPQVTLNLVDLETGQVQEITTDTIVTVRATSEFAIVAVGIDEQGVQSVSLHGLGTKNCSNGGAITSQNIEPSAHNIADPGIGVGDTATDRRIASLSVSGSTFGNCPANSILENIVVSYRALATNFHGGMARTSVNLTLVEPRLD